MKNKTFLDSIKCAFVGLKYGYKTEKNFKYYTIIALFFLLINFLLQMPFYYYIIYTIIVGLVFAMEYVNTVIEHIANSITTEIKDEIKVIKDMGAASVLVCGFIYFISESIMIGSMIW